MEDIAEIYMRTIVIVEDAINARTLHADYGSAITDWDLIGIGLSGDAQGFSEIRRYNKKKNNVEFRLVFDHDIFLNGSDTDRFKLVFFIVMRSLEHCRSMRIDCFDFDKLEKDLKEVGVEHDWIGG